MDNGLRPTPETFKKLLPYFLSDQPGPECAKAGRAAYAAVSLFKSNKEFLKINLKNNCYRV